jgi:type I restriction enzyme S subunit
MNQRAIPTYQVTLLTIEQIRRLTAIMQPLLERAYAARLESDCIAALRDALLPKLLSGDVRVSNAKSFVGEAI